MGVLMRAIAALIERHCLRPRQAAVSALAVAVLALCPSPAGALATGGEHVYDPVLSLTGSGELVSKIDPIPDPGPEHPAEPFKNMTAVAVDPGGYTYVVNETKSPGPNPEGDTSSISYIDIFDPTGHFVTSIDNDYEPKSVAVDGSGVVYVWQKPAYGPTEEDRIVRYTPAVYPPTAVAGYSGPVTVRQEEGFETALAVDPATGHLFALDDLQGLTEYGSAAEGNPVIASHKGGRLEGGHSLTVDSRSDRLFVGNLCPTCGPSPSPQEPHVSVVDVFDLNGDFLEEITGSDTPAGGFGAIVGDVYPAVDETTGELLVADYFSEVPRMYRFVPKSGGGFEYVADPAMEKFEANEFSVIAVANSPGAPDARHVYLTANGSSHSHLFVFGPEPERGAPLVSDVSVSGVGSSDAVFSGSVNPRGFGSEYWFEYVSEQTYSQDVGMSGAGHGFDRASRSSATTLPAGAASSGVSVSVGGLSAGAVYEVRLVAANHCKDAEPEAVCVTDGEATRFATYPGAAVQSGCPNEALRVGVSAILPDCRAFELVSPADMNAREPEGEVSFGPGAFPTELVSPDGASVLFTTYGGALPGMETNGVIDGYEARRTSSGWVTSGAGMSGAESQSPHDGGASSDHEYWFWASQGGADSGSLVIEGKETHWVRLPDHSFRLVGEGPLGSDPQAEGRYIAPHGAHMIFTSARTLTEGASPAGVTSVYDRTPDGEVHVLSTLPDGTVSGAGAAVEYVDASTDGSAVAFTVTEGGVTTLYEHREGAATILVAQGSFPRVGLSADGSRIAFLNNGDVYSFDAASGTSTRIGSGGESTIVNASADGSHIYFVSPAVLSEDPGPVSGRLNFYAWDAESEAIGFIAVLEQSDMEEESHFGYGLRWWHAREAGGPQPARETSRVSADGSTIVFESHASLAGYQTGGHNEIYRYQSDGGGLTCVSCIPTLAAAAGDAHLQIGNGTSTLSYFAPLSTPGIAVSNLSEDGRLVFFQTPEPLLASDVDGVEDVYEWEAQGVGGCTREGGCVSLISSGHSNSPNYLFAATPSGSDVLFTTSDRLTPTDADPTSSIYDARIDGGFPPAAVVPCSAEECKGPLSAPPAAVELATHAAAQGNAQPPLSASSRRLRPPRHCAAARHKHRKGHRKKRKLACVRHHKHKPRHHRAGAAK
jgi:hypothetical protein